MSLFSFHDPVEILNHRFQTIKKQKSDYQVADWAKELQVSPASLAGFLKGTRPLKFHHLSLFQDHLHANPEEWRYLQLLVLKENAQSEDERNLYQHLADQQKQQALKIEKKVIENEDFFSDWLSLTLMNLPLLDGFRWSLESVQKTLKETVNEKDIIHSINQLLQLGVLQFDDQGRMTAQEADVTCKDGIPRKKVHDYYRKTADLALKSLDQKVETREFQCFTLPLYKNQLPRFQEMFRRFRSELIQESQCRGDEVYQVNLHLFPLTERPIEDVDRPPSYDPQTMEENSH